MGSGPSSSDYQPSEIDKTNASVAMAEYNYFKDKYDPLLRQMRDRSMSEDFAEPLRGRANADTMQQLSGVSLDKTKRSEAAGDLSRAYGGQLGAAEVAGKNVEIGMKTNVLGTARGQVADAQTGMAQASRIATSQALQRARSKEQVRAAKFKAGGQIAGAALAQGLDNMNTTAMQDKPLPEGIAGPPAQEQVRGSFFTPASVKTGGSRFSWLGG